jgi:predicted metal-binding protein
MATEDVTLPTTELLVCTTCRPTDAPREGQAAGQTLFEHLEAALAFSDEPSAASVPRLRGIACLGACSRSCSVALQAPGKTCYVFGGLAPDDDSVQAVLSVAQQHAASTDGVLAWAERPQRLRRGLIARLPALAMPPIPGPITVPITGPITGPSA